MDRTSCLALVWDGDNRHPSFAYIPFPHSFFISWESFVGNWEIFKVEGYVQYDSLQWYAYPENITNTPNKNESEVSIIDLGSVTQHISPTPLIYPIASTWRSITFTPFLTDNIGASTSLFYNPTYFSLSSSSTDIHPTLSHGIFLNNFARIWSVWQSDSGGIWKLYGTKVDRIIGAVDERSFTQSFTLFQNYPNPFNPSTTIRFHAEAQSYVTLDVYDILGRKVTTLVNGIISAGLHQVLWNTEDMPSGMYCYHLSALNLSNHQYYHDSKKAIWMR